MRGVQVQASVMSSDDWANTEFVSIIIFSLLVRTNIQIQIEGVRSSLRKYIGGKQVF